MYYRKLKLKKYGHMIKFFKKKTKNILMAKSSKSKKKTKNNDSKLIYIPFVILAIVIGLFIALPYVHSSNTPSSISSTQNNGPLFDLVKISNVGYANTTQVYFISWYGCPYGATLSWPLYTALQDYGNVSVVTHYSITEPDIDNGSQGVPGLIFTGFNSTSNVTFHFLYIYNQNLTATPSGVPLNNNAVSIGLQEIKDNEPYFVYNIIYQYEVNETLPGLLTPIAYGGHPPHIASALIITGPKGTWLLIGYPNPLTPNNLISINNSSSQLLSEIKSGHVPSLINDIAKEIIEAINEAQ
uniref:DUF929 domain-containing protein n=1 Tax=uncultured organism TaxID=155900 RepID=A0A0G2YFW0_9ZZZZ|nr:hypothetical protein [uncultured organism]